MKGFIYKYKDKTGQFLKLPVSVTDAIYHNNEKLSNVIERIHEPYFRFRMLSWNVGHWAKGNASSSTVTAQTYESTKMGFHQVFNNYSPDIVGCCEYSSIFYQNKTAREDIFGQYKDVYIGTEAGYIGTAFFANLVMENKAEIALENNYKAIEFKVRISKDKRIVICMCHLPWQSEQMQQDSLTTLINRYANEEYAIIAGDMNMHANMESNTISRLNNAGYQTSNWGYLGKILTLYNGAAVSVSNYSDNIAVKGGSILRTQVLQNTPQGKDPDNPQIEDETKWDAVNLSDHFPMICDIEFKL